MNLAKAVATLGILLDYNLDRFEAFVDGLIRLSAHQRITEKELRLLIPEGREYLAFEALISTGVLSQKEKVYGELAGALNNERLEWLHDRLGLFIESTNAISREENVRHDAFVELAWTLPSNISIEEGFPRPGSLAGLIKHAVSSAQQNLYLLSPFLDTGGAIELAGPLNGAYKKGVEVNLISHGLGEASTPAYEALLIYKNAIPNLKAYTAPRNRPATPYLLLHAKIVVADAHYAVLSSANLTQYGFRTHLEVGVGLTGEPALQLKELMTQIVKSNLVELIL
jgi:phosphatidylserine/phosphatidylglycerophosphate/cardiolipin synthase-like enzyme